jgi:hypothetical protein
LICTTLAAAYTLTMIWRKILTKKRKERKIHPMNPASIKRRTATKWKNMISMKKNLMGFASGETKSPAFI